METIKKATLIKKEKKVSVVIPYKKTDKNELDYAIKLWHKFYDAGCEVFVIGDKPDFEGDFKHISQEIKSDNPQIDVAHKMLTAIANKDITDDFIWSNDDFFLTSLINLSDICMLVSNGTLTFSDGSLYNSNKERTIEALKEHGLSFHKYSNHTPFYFNKKKLKDVIDKFKCTDKGYLISSLYFNVWHPNAKPYICKGDRSGWYSANVWRDGVDSALLRKVFERKFVCVNEIGYNQCIPLLKELLEHGKLVG